MLGLTEVPTAESPEMFRYKKNADCGIPGCRCMVEAPKCDCFECRYQARLSVRRNNHWMYPDFQVSSITSRREYTNECKCCPSPRTLHVRKESVHERMSDRYRIYDDHLMLTKEHGARQSSLVKEHHHVYTQSRPRVHQEHTSVNRYASSSVVRSPLPVHSVHANITERSSALKQPKLRQKRRFQCMYCDKSFGKSSHLRDHHRTHSGERPFGCRYCGKAFSQFSNLRTHLRIHTGEKPFKCQVCEKSFTQRVTLRSHMRTHVNHNTTVNNFSKE